VDDHPKKGGGGEILRKVPNSRRRDPKKELKGPFLEKGRKRGRGLPEGTLKKTRRHLEDRSGNYLKKGGSGGRGEEVSQDN